MAENTKDEDSGMHFYNTYGMISIFVSDLAFLLEEVRLGVPEACLPCWMLFMCMPQFAAI